MHFSMQPWYEVGSEVLKLGQHDWHISNLIKELYAELMMCSGNSYAGETEDVSVRGATEETKRMNTEVNVAVLPRQVSP